MDYIILVAVIVLFVLFIFVITRPEDNEPPSRPKVVQPKINHQHLATKNNRPLPIVVSKKVDTSGNKDGYYLNEEYGIYEMISPKNPTILSVPDHIELQ